MALSDPQSVTINSVAISLPRVSTGTNASVYSSNDSMTKLTVSHQSGKRNRHVVRLDTRKVAADPLNTAINLEYSESCYLVIDVPRVGYTVAQTKLDVDALLAALSASSGALITKVLGGEN